MSHETTQLRFLTREICSVISAMCVWVGCSGSTSPGDATPGNGGTTSSGGTGIGGNSGSAGAGLGNGASGASTGGSTGTSAPECGGPLQALVNGLCISKMVAVPGGYSIDATEVSRGQYMAWLATSPALPSASDTSCGTKTSYAPDASCLQASVESSLPNGDAHPIVCVDWCDARAYCVGVGKRLCGKIGGGQNATSDNANADTSQWYRACSSGGANTYPYGTSYDGDACNGYDYASTHLTAARVSTLPVGTLASCQSSVSGYQGVFDLAGNVYEWEDSCDDVSGPYCLVRGGAVVGMTNCDLKIGNNPSTTFDDIGIRCCSP